MSEKFSQQRKIGKIADFWQRTQTEISGFPVGTGSTRPLVSTTKGTEYTKKVRGRITGKYPWLKKKKDLTTDLAHFPDSFRVFGVFRGSVLNHERHQTHEKNEIQHTNLPENIRAIGVIRG